MKARPIKMPRRKKALKCRRRWEMIIMILIATDGRGKQSLMGLTTRSQGRHGSTNMIDVLFLSVTSIKSSCAFLIFRRRVFGYGMPTACISFILSSILTYPPIPAFLWYTQLSKIHLSTHHQHKPNKHKNISSCSDFLILNHSTDHQTN